MVESVIRNLRLSNLDGRRIRDTKCLFYMDENSGPNNIEEFKIKEEKKKHRLSLRKNFYDLPLSAKIDERDYQKYNNIKESRLPQPYRDYENYTDPLSHFITAGHDKNRYMQPDAVKVEPFMEPTPSNTNPKDINSNRINCPDVFEELNRSSENDPHVLRHNSRLKALDACKASLRARERLNMIQSLMPAETAPRSSFISNAFPEFTPKNSTEATENDLKALKFMYTSTTQKAYEDVPFDSYLHPRRWSPLSTIETSADPLRAAFMHNKNYPAVDQWKGDVNLNKFESQQLRSDHFFSKRPHDFCAPMKRANQIPTYSGKVGAYNLEDIDNPNVKDFKPFTVCRTTAPKFGDCVERPVFVGYTGNIPTLPGNMKPPFNTDPVPRNVLGQSC